MAPEIFLLNVLLLAATIGVHYETLRLVSHTIDKEKGASRLRLFIVLAFALASHLVHVLLYAAAFYWMTHDGHYGEIINGDGSFSEAFYFSISSYTTLGIGDILPTGAIRILSGMEALNGLVMVGWTASFTYLTMERFWAIGQREENDR